MGTSSKLARVFAALVCLATTGCMRATVETTVNADGTWTRTITYHATKGDGPGAMLGMPGPKPAAPPKAAGGKAKPGTKPAAKPESKLAETINEMSKAFVLPKGEGWTVTRAEKDDEVIYKATRTLQPGDTWKDDFSVRKSGLFEEMISGLMGASKKGGAGGAPPAAKPADGGQKGSDILLSNEVTVHQVAPGRWEYREVIHWRGERPKELNTPDPTTANAIRAALPAALATDANVRDLAQVVTREYWHMLFGPGDPMIAQLFTQMLMHPDLVERRLRRQVGGAIDRALREKFAATLPDADRMAATRKIVNVIMEHSLAHEMKSKGKPGGGGPEDAGMEGMAQSLVEGNLTPVTFSVKLPGKIVSSNGEVDEVSGEVYWAMYTPAPAAGDVVLTATFEMGQ